MDLSTATVERFTLQGEVAPLSDLAKSAGAPSMRRKLGGWLMTYGKLGPDGGIVPTVDRDGHVVEAARELGHIDWRGYIKGGKWNDTHDENCIVGLPDTLEFHDGTTALSKAHGKVGFFTTGHFWDREDPSSWKGLGRTPTPHEFERADHFWELAHLLKGMPRTLGLSAHGSMALSPCKSRIIYAKVDHSAVCEVPKNPDATLELMELALRNSPIQFLRKGMVGRNPCGACSCPAGACEGLVLDKAVTAGTLAPVVPQDLEGAPRADASPNDRVQTLVRFIATEYQTDEATARRWVLAYLHRELESHHGNRRSQDRPEADVQPGRS